MLRALPNSGSTYGSLQRSPNNSETDPSICVGCGGCEYVCPAIPYKSILEGLSKHNIIEIEHDEVEEIMIDGFGF